MSANSLANQRARCLAALAQVSDTAILASWSSVLVHSISMLVPGPQTSLRQGCETDIIPVKVLHSGFTIPHPINERHALAPKILYLGAGKSLTKKLSTTRMTSGISADALMQPPGGPLDTWPAQAMLSLRRCAAKEEQPRHSTLRGAPVTCSAAQRQSRACTHAWGRFGPREYSDCSLLPVVHDKPPFHGHTSITPGPKPNAVATTRRAPQEFHGSGQCTHSTLVLFSLRLSMRQQTGTLRPLIVLMPPSLSLGLVLAVSSSSGPWNN